MATWLGNLQDRGVAVRAAILGAAVVVALAVVAPAATYLCGAAAMAAATVAACLCLAGAGAALIVTDPFREPQHAWTGLLTGMALRMGIPLISGLALQIRGGPLVKAGFLYYLLVFYAVALAVETALSLPQQRRPTSPSQGPSNVAP
jgi:hypothetical protein